MENLEINDAKLREEEIPELIETELFFPKKIIPIFINGDSWGFLASERHVSDKKITYSIFRNYKSDLPDCQSSKSSPYARHIPIKKEVVEILKNIPKEDLATCLYDRQRSACHYGNGKFHPRLLDLK